MNPQVEKALAIAQSCRIAQAALRRRVSEPRPYQASWAELATVLDENREQLRNLSIWQVLGWGHRMSATRRQRLLLIADIRDPYRQIRWLTDRQIAVLADGLRHPEDITSYWRRAA